MQIDFSVPINEEDTETATMGCRHIILKYVEIMVFQEFVHLYPVMVCVRNQRYQRDKDISLKDHIQRIYKGCFPNRLICSGGILFIICE